jgi:cyclin A
VHHLADTALLDYMCVVFLPSVVAASVILQVWPGCVQMMVDWEITARFRYSFTPLFVVIPSINLQYKHALAAANRW